MKLNCLYQRVLLERGNRRAKFQAQCRRIGKTQNELADLVGVDKSTISRYKKGGTARQGGRQPSLDTLRVLAKQGLDVMDLFDIKSAVDIKPRTKSVQRSKAGASRVSDKMLKASRDAQEQDHGSEPTV